MAGDFIPPGANTIPTQAPLYVDGLPVDTVNSVLAAQTPPGQQNANDQRFWASPARPLGDLHDERLTVKLGKPKLINYMALDLPHVPHHFYILYWDDATKKWVEVVGDNGYAIRFYPDGAVPQIIGPSTVLQAHQHPTHYGADHWMHYDIAIRPITTSKFLFIGTRGFGSRNNIQPISPVGKLAPYSLGLRNLDFGYRILTKSDVPVTDRDPDIVTERQSFTQVVDMLGSPVELKMRENRASDLLNGRLWKCEPQPYSYAVVNLYIDARNSSGAAQVVDRFHLDPVTSGVRMNLYYSNADPAPGDFKPADTPLGFPLVRTAGEVDPTIDSDGLVFPGDKISYLDVDNQAVQWDPTKPWWIGVEWQPQFNYTETTDHVIFDTGPFQLVWQNSTWSLGFDTDGLLTMSPFEFGFNQRLQALIGYDGTSVFFYMPNSGAVFVPADLSALACSAIRFGAEQGATVEEDIINANSRLRTFVLKSEARSMSVNTDDTSTLGLVIPEAMQGFLDDPATYVTTPAYDWQEDGSTTNALLRFNAKFISGDVGTGVNPWGFIGGPGDIYAAIAWTPVARDFKLAKGDLEFNPITAKYFKMEFTNLAAQHYDYYGPTTTKVQVFPAQIKQQAQTTVTSQVPNTDAGIATNTDIAPTINFRDAVAITPNPGPNDIPVTEAMYATDPNSAQKLTSLGNIYNFQPWQAPTVAPRFGGTQQHYYETVEVVQQSRIGYFVAISGLEMYRVDYAANDDTEQYIETFADTLNIDPSTMTASNIEATTNYVTNPSFTTLTSPLTIPDGWTLYTTGSVGTTTVTQSSDTSLYGDVALKLTSTALGGTNSDRLGVHYLLRAVDNVDFDNSLALSIYAKRTVGNAVAHCHIDYYGGVGQTNFISSADSDFALGTNQPWTRLEWTDTPPDGVAEAMVTWWFQNGAGAALTAYLDGAQIEPGHVTAYCDGAQPGCTWLGTPDASASTRTGAIVTPWTFVPGRLSTSVDIGPDGVQAHSIVFNSKRKVRGIQFATTQSAASQLLIDPDFDDTTFAAWAPLGDAQPLAASDTYNATIGSTVVVQRVAGNYWDALPLEFTSWDAIEASDPDPYRPVWNDLEGIAGSSSYGGIAYKANVPTTKAGRIYAAARVYAEKPLTEPLALQILDSSGEVLSETDQVVGGGHVTEWFTSYTIGEGGAETITTWADIERMDPSSERPNYNDLELYQWDALDTTVQPLGKDITVRLIQRGVSNDTWYVDTLSLFEDAIVWEFSNDGGENWYAVYDIRNDPRGVFIFPEPTNPRPSSGTQLMWRVTGYRPNLHITSLSIRPWYGAFALGQATNFGGVNGGPNLNPTDHYPRVEDDPRWQTWGGPIPQDWYFEYRQLLLLNRDYVSQISTPEHVEADTFLDPYALPGEEFVPPAPPSEYGPEIYENIYGDEYTGNYGAEAGGDTFTDGFGNGTF